MIKVTFTQRLDYSSSVIISYIHSALHRLLPQYVKPSKKMLVHVHIVIIFIIL
jgi:hypothetical protein